MTSRSLPRTTIFLLAFAVLTAVVADARGRSESAQPSPDPARESPAASPSYAADLKLLASAGFETVTRQTESTDFELELLPSGKAKLSSYRGKLVLLNFWATWCPSCRQEIPSLERLSAKLKDRQFVLVAVDLDEPKAIVQDFIRKNGMTYPVLLDPGSSVGALYGARSIPITYVIDRDGRVLARTIGPREWDSPSTLALFESLLKL